jgi:hypothetical protein
MVEETHPELGVSGNDTQKYCQFDAAGNPRKRSLGAGVSCPGASGPFDLSFTYDRAQRLTDIWHGATQLKHFGYYTANTAGWSSGKLASAIRYNPNVDIGSQRRRL